MSTRINNHKMCTKGSFIFLNHVHSYMELPTSFFAKILKLRFIDADTRSTTQQTPVSVTDNGNPGPVDIPHESRLPCDMETFCDIVNTGENVIVV